MARPPTWRLFTVFSSILIIIIYFLSSHELSDSTKMGSSGVIHIVHFQFKAGTSESEKQNVAQEMLALKGRCLHPETGKPYINSFTGGKDNSPEGLSDGLEYAFVVEFENTEDRDYYVFKDPAHDTFKALGGKLFERAVVVDYNKGVF